MTSSKQLAEPRFDLLILDFDGTLVDSQAILVALVNDTLEANGFPRAEASIIATSIGLPLDLVFQRALPPVSTSAIAALCEHYRNRADATEFVQQFRLYDGVGDTLGCLHAHGVRLVVATSKGRATTMDITRHCEIDTILDDVIGGDCVTHGKPHREMVEQALAKFTTPSTRTLVVGDTSFDIEMGQAAGVATCAVTYGMHDADALRELRPDFLIDRFESLLEIVLDTHPHPSSRSRMTTGGGPV